MAGNRLRAGAFVCSAALAVLLVACGSEATTLDRPRSEAAIRDAVSDVLPVEVDGVECPQEIPRGAGRTFRCDVLTSAGPIDVDVDQTDGDGLEVEIVETVADRAEVAAELEADLEETFGRSFDADCGSGGAFVIAVGGVISCDVSDEHGEREVEVTIADAAGGLAVQVG